MAAVLDLITAALVTVKALAVGETPGPDMTTDALDKFNDVLEALSIQNLAVYSTADTFAMPPGYRRLIRLMLAWELRTDYPGLGAQELQNLKDDVAGALGSVKRANIEPVMLRSEVADLDASGGGYVNWRDGA